MPSVENTVSIFEDIVPQKLKCPKPYAVRYLAWPYFPVNYRLDALSDGYCIAARMIPLSLCITECPGLWSTPYALSRSSCFLNQSVDLFDAVENSASEIIRLTFS